MLREEWLKVVAASVVPVVIISACGLLCLAFYNRLSAVVSRLRGFHRERLHEQLQLDRYGGAPTDPAAAEALRRHERLLAVLQEQTGRVFRRAKLIQSTLLCLLSTIACLTLCSLLTGFSVIVPAAAGAAIALFLAGLVLLLAGVVLAIMELRRALDPVELEGRFVDSLAADERTPHGAADGA